MPYAWAPIHLAKDHEDGKRVVRNVIQPGEEVNKSDFTAEDWKQLHEEGVIRKQRYPEGVNLGESVRTAVIRQANEARENALNNVPNFEIDEENPDDHDKPRKPWER